jgi:hypothetical protein
MYLHHIRFGNCSRAISLPFTQRESTSSSAINMYNMLSQGLTMDSIHLMDAHIEKMICMLMLIVAQ